MGYRVSSVRDQKLLKLHVADESGSVTLCVWNMDAESIAEGDILQLQDCKTNLHLGQLCLYATPDNMSRVGEFFLLFRRHPNMTNARWQMNPNNSALSAMIPVFDNIA
eukprot:c49358_g1_i1.p1 GENE.c49358_g1_i1~~c49358_g1_i1.p1  ORF type:complete len:108 (-),score=13.79 c49358_g1_i1:92-415(-)